MKSEHPDHRLSISTLVRVLSTHYEGLVTASANETMLRQYASLLRFLKSKRGANLREIFADPVVDVTPRTPAYSLTEDQISKLSLDELERLANDEATPRKDLECVAIQRFKVPRGSMRSYSNRRMLVDKLRVLISNERAHTTIDTVAREQGRRSSE
jgi:hypothetical protein